MTEPNAKRARLEDDDQAAIEVTPMDGGGGGGGGTYIFSRANFFFCGKSVCAHLGELFMLLIHNTPWSRDARVTKRSVMHTHAQNTTQKRTHKCLPAPMRIHGLPRALLTSRVISS